MIEHSRHSIALEARHVTIRYRDTDGRLASTHAVRDLSMKFASEEVALIIGESGAGKSSLLAAMARLIPIASGQVILFGEDYTHADYKRMRHLRRRIQLMPQDAVGSFDPRWHLGKTLDAAIRWLRPDWSPQEARTAQQWAVDITGFDARKLHRHPEHCSGGEMKRIALTRALICKPDVLLLDEPLAGLDRQSQELLVSCLQRAKHSHPMCIVLISHDTHLLLDFSDRVLVMDNGAFVEDCPAGLGGVPLAHQSAPLLSPDRRVLKGLQ